METPAVNKPSLSEEKQSISRMRRFGFRSLSFKFSVTILLGLALVELTVYSIERHRLQKHLEHVAIKEAMTLTESLEYALEGLAEAGDQGAIRRMVQNQCLFDNVSSLSVINPDDIIIASGDSQMINKTQAEHIDIEINGLIHQARLSNRSQSIYRSHEDKRELVFVLPLRGTLFKDSEKRHGGVAALVLNLDWIDTALNELIFSHLKTVIPGLFVVAAIVVFAQRAIVLKPLNDLANMIDIYAPQLGVDQSNFKDNEISAISRQLSELFQALELANHRFELAVAGSNDGLFDYHPHSGYCWYSRHFNALLGLDEDELKHEASSWLDRIHPDHREQAKAILAEHIKKNQAFTLEYPILKKNGSYLWVQVRGRPSSNEHGEVTHVSGSVRDINERKRIEDELRIQRLELQAILDAIPAYIFYKNGENQILHMNQAAAQLIGLPRESLEGLYMHELLSHKEAQLELKRDQKVLASGMPSLDIVEPFDTPSGKRVWIRTDRMPLDFNHDHARLVVVSTDITQQRATERRLNMAINGAKLGLWDWDLTSNEVYYNHIWFEMLGYEAEGFDNTFATFENFCHPDDLPRVKTALDNHLNNHSKAYRLDLRLKHKDGHWHWIQTVGEASDRDSMGKPKRMSGVHYDIHEQKMLEEELRTAQVSAQTANKAKSEFLANMTHELRTPLTAILGFTDIIKGDESLNSQQSDALRTIERNGQHLLTLINDILDMSKIEAGKMTTESIPMDPALILNEVKASFQKDADNKGISLELSSTTELTMIQSDPVRFRQIVFNLISNAIKFTHQGSVTMQVSYIQSDTETPQLRVDVIDSGIGMSPIQAQNLFQAFTQADNSTTRKYGGTGLGLRISKTLAGMLGGDLTVKSELGQGSCFTLLIKAEKAETSERETDAKIENKPLQASPLQGRRILLAEDGLDNQRLITFLLKKAGAAVTVVENGKLAIDQISTQEESASHFDLVLMDMQMPELDGYQATRQLRELGYNIPVIALTANALSGDREKCLAAGCTDYASKPINRDKLIETCLRHAA